MVGADVGDDADVVGGDAHALEQHAAAGGLEDADLQPRRLEHAARPGRAGVVARLVRLAHDDDAVGGAPGVLSPAVMHMCAMRRVVVVLPLVPVTEATGTRRLDDVGGGRPGEARMTRGGRLDDLAASPRASSSPASMAPICSPATWPRVRRTQGKAMTTSVDGLAGPHAHAEPPDPDLGADPPGHGADDAHDEPLAQGACPAARAGAAASRAGARAPRPRCAAGRGSRAGARLTLIAGRAK